MNVDVRLQQTPQAWLTAKGYAPLSLFRPHAAGAPRATQSRAPGEAIDLQVASSQIDLGVIQGFTSYVTNVTGALQANVKVTGSGYDPHFDGAIDIRGGAFAVPELGTAYTGLDTRIDLNDERSDDQRVQDSRRPRVPDDRRRHARGARARGRRRRREDAVGELRGHRQRAGRPEAGHGHPRSPVSCGSRGSKASSKSRTASMDVARVLELVTAEPVCDRGDRARPGRARAGRPAPAAGADRRDADRLRGAVDGAGHRRCRATWCCAATDLRPANAPIDIGDMNVTVGGAVQLRKDAGDRRVRILRRGQHRPRQLHLPGPPLRDHARRPHPVHRRPTSIDPHRRHPRAPRHLRRRDDRPRAGHDADAGADVQQQPAARPGGHPVAHRLQRADQRAGRRAAGLAGAAGRRAGGRLPDVGPHAVDCRRAGARRVRDPGAGRAGQRAQR